MFTGRSVLVVERMPWVVNQTTYVAVEIVVVGIAAVLTMLGGHYWGIRYGILIAMAFSILVPSRSLILQTHEGKRLAGVPSAVKLTQQEYDALPEKDEHTVYYIVPKD